MYIHTPAKHRRSGSAMQKMKGRGATKRFLSSRMIKTGYPLQTQFTNREEIEEYLSGDRVTCLLCGKDYKDVGLHIKVHGTNIDDYKYRYGIPQRYSIMGKATLNLKEQNGAPHLKAYVGTKHLQKTLRKPRRLVPLLIKEGTERINKDEHHNPVYTDFTWHLEQVIKYFNYRDVPVPMGKISWSAYKKRRIRDKQVNLAYIKARNKRIKGLKFNQDN